MIHLLKKYLPVLLGFTFMINTGIAAQKTMHGTRINARGAFSCDFQIDLTQQSEPIGAEIERDRIFSQRFVKDYTSPSHPGMLQKHIPIIQDSPTTGFSGGRYLFQSRRQAKKYEQFIKELFVYPANVPFLSRPTFLNPECRDWGVVRAWNFQELESHVALRTERFDTGKTTLAEELILRQKLKRRASSIIQEALNRNYAEIQILHNMQDHKVQLVYFISRRSGPDPQQPDGLAFQELASASPIGSSIESLGLTRVFDLTSFVLTIWLPYESGDQGEAALWPNSPPFPAPACGDNVCIPSQGENYSSCPADCSASCGNGICETGETLTTCPSDCEIPIIGPPSSSACSVSSPSHLKFTKN
ncbi:MAG: hypothetical protein CL678_07825 [Bdellovibrionaceae bacterium]|nr:hypothetical protein [Pseudobdellovibrionaceae bacterium]|tara:strand:- start:997 stop:2076 length:1080 start_codon:yes stop_codon:yes gene_type:complete